MDQLRHWRCLDARFSEAVDLDEVEPVGELFATPLSGLWRRNDRGLALCKQVLPLSIQLDKSCRTSHAVRALPS